MAKEFHPRAIGSKIKTKLGDIGEAASPESIRKNLTTRKAVLGSIAAEGVICMAAGAAGIFTNTQEAASASTIVFTEGVAIYLLSRGLRMDEEDPNKQDYNCLSLDGIDNTILQKLDKIRPEKARNLAKRAITVFYIGKSRASHEELPLQGQTS